METMATFGAAVLALLSYRRAYELFDYGEDGKACALFALSLLCLAYIGLKALSEVMS